uniref:Putative FAD binding domain in molybdopterin dehydrogenase n=1 Tax=uncultured marine microorganism HF4000_APKG8C21 TaxID=455553 RepID=B3TA15_9ZZZZ|nr:putative FAD binding domain in molybdopterin dehydrogenase [uncultured marine microorganism HF4000_APKG8C21]
MTTSTFEYYAPTSVAEAAELLARHGDKAKLLAGGHSLVPLMKVRLARPEVLISLGKIDSMAYIRESDGGLAIGAMTTYSQLESSDLVKSRAPLLAEAAGLVADPQVRNMGTIGGSLAHSDPAGDLPAVALALGAQLITSSTGDHRTINADDFFVDLLTTSLRPNEILSEIVIPALAPRTGTAYAKFANKASHFAVVGVAAVVTLGLDGACQDARVGVTGAGPKATRATETESALKGSRLDDSTIRSAAQSAGAGIEFNADIFASADYRAHLVTVYAGRAIREAASRAA